MGTTEEEKRHLRNGLHEMFVPGGSLEHGCAIVEVRDSPTAVVLLVRWDRDPRLYGIPIDIEDISRDFYYTDFPVDSAQEWLESVDVGLTVHLGTGFRGSARRTAVEDYIELRAEGGWPVDERFHFGVVEPADPHGWLRVPFVKRSGLDPTPAVASLDSGRLIAWVVCFENNSTGSPYVGQAVVSWTGDSVAALEDVEVAAGVPVTVVVDLAQLGAHVAGDAGALSVVTDLEVAELEVAGFLAGEAGRRVVDTSFLDEDPVGAARLLHEAMAVPSQWGQDRDAAGRYLPGSRPSRWWHRLKHGPDGAPPHVRWE
jgi:hypothetical protein